MHIASARCRSPKRSLVQNPLARSGKLTSDHPSKPPARYRPQCSRRNHRCSGLSVYQQRIACDPTPQDEPIARSLAERLRSHEQQKAKLAEQEAKLKDAERKARTRRLIEAGALVEKAGLLELNANALYGALLSLRDGVDNARQIEQWTALGGRTFARETQARDAGKEPVVLTFPNALAKGTTASLRAAGFRFNKVLQHWEGLARFDEAEQLAGAHGGTACRVTPLPSPAKLVAAAE